LQQCKKGWPRCPSCKTQLSLTNAGAAPEEDGAEAGAVLDDTAPCWKCQAPVRSSWPRCPGCKAEKRPEAAYPQPPFTQSTQPSSPSAPFAPEKDDPEKDDADAQGTLPCLHPPCLDQLTHVTAFDQLTDLAAFSHTPQGPALQTLVLESSNPSPRVRPEDYNILVACHLMPNVSRCCRNAGIDCQSVGRGVGVVGGGVVCGGGVWIKVWCERSRPRCNLIGIGISV